MRIELWGEVIFVVWCVKLYVLYSIIYIIVDNYYIIEIKFL